MNLFILSLITFLIPVGVVAIGLLDVYSNRNLGISRSLYSAFLFSVLCFFLFNLMTEVEMGSFQIIAFVVLMPISMLAGPLFLMFQKSLMGKKSKLLGNYGIIWNFIPAIFSVFILLIGILLFSFEEVNEILTSPTIDKGANYMVIARWVLIFAHVLWYIQLFWYGKKVNQVIDVQKRKYGKFFATYEERNEYLMQRQLLVLLLIAVYDLMFWIFRFRESWPLIMVNIIFGVFLTYMILSGREQINIKRYRMYKLNSHEDEIKKGVYSRKASRKRQPI